MSLSSSLSSDSSNWTVIGSESSHTYCGKRAMAHLRSTLHQVLSSDASREATEDEDWEQIDAEIHDSSSHEGIYDWIQVANAADIEIAVVPSGLGQIVAARGAKSLEQTRHIANKLGTRGVVEAKKAVRQVVATVPHITGALALTGSWVILTAVPGVAWAIIICRH